ncbi:uncharacterized protein [Diadema setosum]|uniref:uncharacterized protein n=1 Tax=Diadema setosum TaxID=31175 RepID=UPI003B3A50E4
MKDKQRSLVFTVSPFCFWLCCLSGVVAENCTSLDWVTFANIIYDPPASAGADTYPEGTVARTQCDDKYAVFPRASSERTCVDGSWSGPRSSCRHISRLCRRNDFLVEFYGRTCSTACLNRPGRACPRDQSCMCDGVCGWSCLANENCTALTIKNGHLLHYEVGDIIPHGSVVEYGCDDGYEGVPSGHVECRRGNLLPEVPTCSPAVLTESKF